ncbi:MAG: hypothetical protein ABIJ24_03715 [Nitrospinota bacterium]|nr:hypothetical protein [Nitrospinota bacterium]
MITIKEKRGLSAEDTLFYAAGIAIFVIATLIYLWPSVKIISLRREFDRVESERKDLSRHNSLLRIELQSLRSYEGIENEAVKKGFRLPRRGEVIYIETEPEAK